MNDIREMLSICSVEVGKDINTQRIRLWLSITFLLIFQEHTHTHTHNWHIYSNWFSRNNAEKFFFAVLHACHESHKYLNCNRSNYPQLPSHQSKRQQTPCRYKWFIALSHSCWCCWCLFFCSLISRLSLYRDNKAKQTKMHGDESFSNWK